jgi:hypothetical protein
MTTLGWMFMITSLGFVWGLVLWCYKKVLSAPTAPPQQLEDFHSA